MSKKNKKTLRVNRQRNSYIIGISIGVLAGIIFGYATDSIIVSILVCGLLGFGMGHSPHGRPKLTNGDGQVTVANFLVHSSTQ
jgi:hypothetical protein